MNMNMDWYRIFWHTAKLGNLTRAAQELHITQPSVSYAIKQLEAQLEVKLFDRLSKGVKLTSEGMEVFKYVEKSFTTLQSGEDRLQKLKELSAGELRIGASGPIIKHFVLPLLDTYHAEYPEVRIRLSQGKTSDIRERLKTGQIDVGIVHFPFADHELTVQHLANIQDCFVVGHAYQHLSQKPLTAHELSNLPLLLLSEGSSTRKYVDQWFSSQGIQADADMELSSMDMLIELAGRGYGAAFVTQSFVKQELAEGKLFQLHTKEPISPRAVGFAARRDSTLSIAATRFTELLQ
ncbi:LysR family transcriptional regulator [Paenibacillus sp. FSL H8-0548]|uniref:LysR family transcriptional regulator n=1 Tax=Paenibacillus sp. FSL H8-0548 TaxID=1920422 RepID=UPI00096D72BA|nr:LysR family transcriptional regulator [Paenibacillus sp. FSL H8-0548]OMF38387.1 LysR family transcriptional regulator [Paenibacillus sp. FSL H8-0548]